MRLELVGGGITPSLMILGGPGASLGFAQRLTCFFLPSFLSLFVAFEMCELTAIAVIIDGVAWLGHGPFVENITMHSKSSIVMQREKISSQRSFTGCFGRSKDRASKKRSTHNKSQSKGIAIACLLSHLSTFLLLQSPWFLPMSLCTPQA